MIKCSANVLCAHLVHTFFCTAMVPLSLNAPCMARSFLCLPLLQGFTSPPWIPYQPKFNSIHLQRMICCPDMSPLKVMSTRWMLDAAETSTLTHDRQKLLQQWNLSSEDVLVFCVYVKMLNATPRHGVINQNWPRWWIRIGQIADASRPDLIVLHALIIQIFSSLLQTCSSVSPLSLG